MVHSETSEELLGCRLKGWRYCFAGVVSCGLSVVCCLQATIASVCVSGLLVEAGRKY